MSPKARFHLLVGWWRARPHAQVVAGILVTTLFVWVASWLLAPHALPDASFEEIRVAQDQACAIFVVLVGPCALLGVALPDQRGLHHALLFVCFVLGASVYFPYSNDDALIFSRYAQHLAAGDGLVFNVGERVEGITSLAWVAILAFFMRIGAHPVVAGKVLGDVLLFLSAALLYRVIHRASRSGRAAFLTTLLFVCDQHVLSWAGSGMDVALFVFWILAWVASVQRDEGLDIGWGTVALAVTGWYVRPEAALFIAAGLLWLWARAPRRAAQVPRLALVGAAFVALVLGRWLYFERIVPNTYVAKSGMQLNDPLPWFRQAIDYLTLPFLGVAGAGLWLLRARFGWLIVVLGVMIAHFYRAGGDVLSIRFTLFVLPLFMLGVGKLLAAIDQQSKGRGVAPLVVAAALAAPMFPRLYGALDREPGNEAAHEYVASNATVSYAVDYLAAQHVRARSQPDDLLVSDNIGVIGYYGECRMLDTYGLTNRDLADRFAQGGPIDVSAEIAAMRPRWILANPAGWIWAAGTLPTHTRGDYEVVGRWESYGWSRILLERRAQ